jgi:succinate dehydrogenase / fumarate reductase cytochrome b subunit
MIESEPSAESQPKGRGCRGKCGCAHRSSVITGEEAAAATLEAPAIAALEAPAIAALEPATSAVEAAGSERKGNCACAGLRPYRRMHSIAGLAFAAFLCVHFLTGASALSPGAFQADANGLREIAERLPGIELLAVGVPLLALVALGCYLLFEAGLSPTRKRCDRGGKTRYFLQRVSALIVLAFVVFHVATLSPWGLHGGAFDPSRAFDSVAGAVRANALVAAFYLLAICAVSYHLANGLWSGAIAWGAISSERAKQRWQLACAAFGIALCSAGLIAWYAFVIATGYA